VRCQETGDEKIRKERERRREKERERYIYIYIYITKGRNRKRARKPESSSSLLPYPFDPSDGIPPRPMGLPAASINKLQLLRFSLPQFSLRHSIPPLPFSLSFRGMAPTENVSRGEKDIFPTTLSHFLSHSLLLSALGSGNRGNPHRSVK